MICGCGEEYPLARHALGYRTCLLCGDKQAKNIKRCVAPLNKSNYVLITNYTELSQLNPKR